METSTEETSITARRRARTIWIAGGGVLAAASLAGVIFAGVANADEAPTGGDRTTEEESTDGSAPNSRADGPNGGHGRPGPDGQAGREGMRDGGPGHNGSGPDGMQPGDHGDCDEQSGGGAGADADA